MSGPGVVFDGDMHERDLTDTELEQLLAAGDDAPTDHPVAAFVADARAALAHTGAPRPSPALLEYLDVAPVPALDDEPPVEIVDLVAASPRSGRKPRMFPAIAAFTAYMICGAYITGALSVPVLPDIDGDPATVVEVADTTDTTGAPEVVTQPEPLATMSSPHSTTTAGAAATTASTTAPSTTSASASLDRSASPTTAASSSSSGSSGSDSTSSSSTSTSSSTSSSSTSSSSTSSSSTSTTSGAVAPTVLDQAVPYGVPGVGTVVVRVTGGVVTITDVVAAAGWTVESHTSDGFEAKVRFVAGDDRVRIDAEIDDGLLRIRTRDERADDRTETEAEFDDGAQVGATVVTTHDDSSGHHDGTDDHTDQHDDPDAEDDGT